jgi:formylglycine-generating enzyme
MSFARSDCGWSLFVLFVALLCSCSDRDGTQSTKPFVPGFIEPTSAERQDPFAGRHAGQVREDNGLKLKLVWCPAGRFLMGSPPDEAGHYEDYWRGKDRDPEKQAPVTLTHGFWLGQYEVTQAQWRRVIAWTPWHGYDGAKFDTVKEGDNYPASFVSWNDAMSFCDKLTESERASGRLSADWEYTLPTEAQWEYACRAGTTSAYSFGASASKLGDYAWYGDNALRLPGRLAAFQLYAHAVGLKKPNPWGLYDLHGNVSEWCRDYRADNLPGGMDPCVTFPDRDFYREVRGGNWGSEENRCRSAARDDEFPASCRAYIGFRVAAMPSGKSSGRAGANVRSIQD